MGIVHRIFVLIRNWSAEQWAVRSGRTRRVVLQDESPREIIAFTSLRPTQSTTALRTFAELTPHALSLQCKAFAYQQGTFLHQKGFVLLTQAEGRYLSASVRDGTFYETQITLINGQMVARCDCGENGLAAPNDELPSLCKHVVATLLAYRETIPVEEAPAEDNVATCPVTRQTLRPGQRIFQCRQCQMPYSPEGWEFLRTSDRGRCCGCGNQKTVMPALLPR